MTRSVVVLVCSAPVSVASAQVTCPGTLPAVRAGELDNGSRNEISGLAASRLAPHLFWVHEDSGDAPRVYALDDTGHQLASFDVTGATATDWEDIASSLDNDGVRRLYVGDIGDNAQRRSRVTVWRFPEPPVNRQAPVGGATARAERIDLTWPDGPRNAETLIVDGARGELIVVSKSSSGASDVMVAPTTPGAHVLSYEGTLRFGSAPLQASSVETTGGDLAPDGSAVVVRTYGDAWWWPVVGSESVAEALLREDPCEIPIPGDQQGEAIAFNRRGGALVTMSEGAYTPVWRIPLAF